MESLKNKIVLITGATSGIGEACTYAFAEQGANVIICARRVEKLKKMKQDIIEKYGVKVHSFELDVRDRKAVADSINNLPDEWKAVDILINNAGLARGMNRLYEDNPDGWDQMIDTNIKGLLNVTREVVKGMAERQKGHVINLGSTAGHEAYPGGGVYCATKYAVRAITNALRMETLDKNIRVSSVDPGLVETEFSEVRFNGDKDKAKNVYRGMKPLFGEDIADAVLFCATRPPHANIFEMIIAPSAQASATMVRRDVVDGD